MKILCSLVDKMSSLLTLIILIFFWQHSFLATALLVLVSAIALAYRFNKVKLLIFLAGFVLGPLSEMVMIHFGAWHYSMPDFLGIPLWLPVTWGNAALFFYKLTTKLQKML